MATGLTFSKIALETKDESKIVRNRANARKAYDAVLHFAPGTSLSAEEAQQIDASMALLKSALQQLGEDLWIPQSLLVSKTRLSLFDPPTLMREHEVHKDVPAHKSIRAHDAILSPAFEMCGPIRGAIGESRSRRLIPAFKLAFKIRRSSQ